jgi:type IV fimbrial biogenesis protein FimT
VIDSRLSHSGHTLPELVTMLGIAAVLAAAAVPTFSSLLLDSRRNAAVTTAVHAANFARQFSATRGETIELCGSDDERACSGREDWTAGLLVRAATGDHLRFLPLAGETGTPTVRSNRAIVRFEGGSGYASPVTLAICDRRGANAARAVIVSRSGRPRVSTRSASGEALAC